MERNHIQTNRSNKANFSIEQNANQFEEADTNSFSGQQQDELFLRKTMEQNPREGCSLLFRKFYAPLCSHAVRYIYSKEIVEDLVAQVFCDFWEKQLYKQVQFSYRAFLYGMVRNRSVDLLRKELGKNSLIDMASLPLETLQMPPEQLMLYDELFNTIGQVVETLPSQCKKVFLLSRFEGKKNQEIAKQLQLSQRTVETHISKALSTLRQALKQTGFVLIFLISLLLSR